MAGPGYTLGKVSAAVPATGIAQIAFLPSNPAHVYAARTSGVVTRYDYDSLTGRLTNALDVASTPGWAVYGLGFHGSDLYVSLNAPPAGARLSRFSNPDASGIYRTRHDFVHSIPTKTHGIDQVQIVGSTLYVGIGAASRTGNPAVENVYTMTVARIVDLRQIDFSGPIGSDFTGPINHLADRVEWLNTAGTDGQLRYYASGFRNPFGIAIDADGASGCRPMATATPVSSPRTSCTRRSRWVARATSLPRRSGSGGHTSSALRSSRSQTWARARRQRAWRSCRRAPTWESSWSPSMERATDPSDTTCCWSIPVTGTTALLVTGLKGPTAVVADPSGRLLIADYNDSSVWLLTYTGAPDVTPPLAGPVTALNTRYSYWVSSPFDLSATFSDNESAVTRCEYTIDGGLTWRPATVSGAMPSFTCAVHGITAANGQTLRVSMRATSEGGTGQGAALPVIVDSLPPTGSVKINAGAKWTRLPAVSLSLAATDASRVAAMCISNTTSCTAWQAPAGARSWTLAPGDGMKMVYVWFRDRVGNVTATPIQAQILLDGTPPSNPSTFTSSSHRASTWSANRTVLIHWAGAADAGSGVLGYSLKWDWYPTTIPDAIADTTALTLTSPPLKDGINYYLHLRTVDQAGNWSPGAVHLGAFLIDGTPPVNGVLAATAGAAKVSLAWSRFYDQMSGLSATSPYRLVYSSATYPAASCTSGTAIFTGAASQFEHQNLVPGTRYYYRLCATDKAGNVSSGAYATAVAQ